MQQQRRVYKSLNDWVNFRRFRLTILNLAGDKVVAAIFDWHYKLKDVHRLRRIMAIKARIKTIKVLSDIILSVGWFKDKSS